MEKQAGALTVALKSSILGLKTGIASAKMELRGLGGFVQQNAAQFRMLGMGATVAGGLITAGLGLCVKAAGDVEKAYADIVAVSDELKGGSEAAAMALKRVQEVAEELGKATKFSTKEVAEGMKFVAMAGYDVNEMLTAMPGLVNLAAAADQDLAFAADALTNILSGFGETANETNRYVDVMAATAANANVNLSEVAEAMKYVAPAAKDMGFSVEKTAAMIGKLGDAGIKGSMAGRNLRMAFIAWMKLEVGVYTSTQVEVMNKYKDSIAGTSITFDDFMGKVKSGEISFQDFIKGMREGGAKTGEFSVMFGAASSTMISVLADQSDAVVEFTGYLDDAKGAAQEMADIKLDTFKGQMDVLKGSVETFAAEIGQILIPILKDMMAKGTEIVNKLMEWTKEHPKLTGALTKFAAVIGPLMLVGGPMLMMAPAMVNAVAGIKGLLGVVGTIIPVIKGLGTALTTAFVSMGPAGWIILAIGAAAAGIYYLYTHSEAFRNALAWLWDKLKLVGNFLKDIFVARLESLIEKVKSTWEIMKIVGAFLRDVFVGAWEAVSEAVGKVVDWFGDKWDKLLGIKGTVFDAWGKGWKSVKKGASEIFDKVKSGFLKVIDWFKNNWMVFLGPAGMIYKAWTDNWGGIQEKVGGLVEGIKKPFIGIGNAMREFGNEAFGKAKGFLMGLSGWKDKIVEVATEYGKAILDYFLALPAKMIEAGKAIITGWIDGIKGAIDKVKEVGGWIAGKLADFIGSSLPTEGPLAHPEKGGQAIIEAWAGGIKKGAPAVEEAVEVVVEIVESLAEKVAKTWKDAFESITRAAFSSIVDVIRGVATLEEAFLNFAKKLQTVVADALLNLAIQAAAMGDVVGAVLLGLGALVVSVFDKIAEAISEWFKTEEQKEMEAAWMEFGENLKNMFADIGQAMHDTIAGAERDLASLIAKQAELEVNTREKLIKELDNYYDYRELREMTLTELLELAAKTREEIEKGTLEEVAETAEETAQREKDAKIAALKAIIEGHEKEQKAIDMKIALIKVEIKALQAKMYAEQAVAALAAGNMKDFEKYMKLSEEAMQESIDALEDLEKQWEDTGEATEGATEAAKEFGREGKRSADNVRDAFGRTRKQIEDLEGSTDQARIGIEQWGEDGKRNIDVIQEAFKDARYILDEFRNDMIALPKRIDFEIIGKLDMPKISDITIPVRFAYEQLRKFKMGITYVPYTMPAIIHEAEAVLNPQQAEEWRAGKGGGGGGVVVERGAVQIRVQNLNTKADKEELVDLVKESLITVTTNKMRRVGS